MYSVTASLIKTKTDDGMMEMGRHIPLGKKYIVYPETRQFRTGFNIICHKYWQREMVEVDNGEWLPTEMLDWEGK